VTDGLVPDYEPPFEMPDYKVLGEALLALTRSHMGCDGDDGPPADEDEFDGDSFGKEAWAGLGMVLTVDGVESQESDGEEASVARAGVRSAATTSRVARSTPAVVPVQVPRTRLQTRAASRRAAVPRAAAASTSSVGMRMPLTTGRQGTRTATAKPTARSTMKERGNVEILLRFEESETHSEEDFLFDV
jgi:hypothetical protein